EETLLLAEESRSKMIEKQNDPQMIENKVVTKPINYDILNKLSTDFETRFVSQTESSAEQAFWSQYSVQTDEPNLSGTTTVEVPKELPKVKGKWGFEHTKACFLDDIIPFVKSLKELFTSFDQCLIDEVTEVQNVFTQMELAVEQYREEKSKVQTKMENVLQENDRLLTQALSVEITYKQLYDSIKSSRVRSKEQCNDLIKKVNIKSAEVSDLNARLQKKVLVITALKEQLDKLKGKAVLTEAVSLNPIDPELLKADVTPVVPKLRKNRTAHNDYIRHTQEEASTLRKIVKSKRLLSPLNTSLDYA
nr:hypothetical protein [Tanacetum cinerariifolium]